MMLFILLFLEPLFVMLFRCLQYKKHHQRYLSQHQDYSILYYITLYYITLYYPPPCRQARLGVFDPSSGGLMSGICLFLRGPQRVSCATRILFFENFLGSYFLMTFWSPMIPQSVQVGLHVGSFLESCCLTFPIFSGVYLGS